MRTLAIGLLAAGCALVWRPAAVDACSVTPTFLPPTNVELVASTPRIVVASVTSAPSGEEVELEVSRVIKGSGIAVGDSIRVRGSLFRYRGASVAGDFSRARPGAYAGSCTAWDYAVKKSYVLFLAEYGGRWDTVGIPFARVNEELEPIWLRSVEEYSRIGAISDAKKRAAALQALIARGKKKKASAVDRAIATDVELHLATPSPRKPFADLHLMFTNARGREKATVVLAMGVGGDRAAMRFMRELVTAARDGKSPIDERLLFEAIGAYFTARPIIDTLTEIGEIYVSLGTKRKQDRWPLMHLLIQRAGDPHKQIMTRALTGADDEEAGRLAAWFVRHPVPVALDDIRARVGADYAAKWELAFSLAGMGDEKVVKWAKQMLAGGPDDERWIALYALARSPRKEADALAGKVIKAGGEDLVHLIQGYGEASHPRAAARLKQLAGMKLTGEQKKWLDRTLADRAGK